MTNFRFGRDVAPHLRPPVCWYHPLVLFKIALDVLLSLNQFRNRDERENFTLPLTLIDRSRSSDDNFWFDFMADTGDGGNATYAVATTALADSKIGSVHRQDGFPLRIWSIISSAFGSSDLGALRRYKSLMWLGHTARFAPSIASQL